MEEIEIIEDKNYTLWMQVDQDIWAEISVGLHNQTHRFSELEEIGILNVASFRAYIRNDGKLEE